jgi:hypothetical protein
MKLTIDKINCYKFTRPNGEWSIVAANDDFLARELFMKEYHISDKKYTKEKIKIEKIKYSYRVRCPYFQKPVTVGSLVGVVKFFPRVIADFED